MPALSSAVLTHPGLRRDTNEDSVCARPDLGLFVVADGMGGHAAGEVASQLAVETIETFIADTRDADSPGSWPFPYDTRISLDANRLTAAFRLANRRIAAAAHDADALRGMATTAAAVLAGAGTPVVAHVGDSRVYRLRQGVLTQLTEDHSWVGEQVRAGALSEADAQQHPWRHVVTRALSGADDPAVAVQEVEVRAGDRMLICSDGLSGVVPADRLEEIASRPAPLDTICQALVEAANQAGGPDNITVALVQIDVA